MTSTVRIGGAGAGYGDGTMAAPRLLRDGALDYIIFDYLSEYFMPIAGRMRQQDARGGYAPDFPEGLFAAILPELTARRVKLVTNVGAVNPRECANAMMAVASRLGFAPRIAVVEGDDLLARASELHAAGRLATALANGAVYTGINAYLGAFPIARALAMGADIVITGRVVDSALVLGPLIHAFDWKPDDYDALAAGSVIGHLLECGAQTTGGLFTDWREIGDYSDIGYPIAECYADGTAIITKPQGTGGRVSVGTVSEQLLYEIGDPRCYRLPDVTVDFSEVRIEQVGLDEVRVSNAKGRPPGDDLKVIATWDDGWLASWGFVVRGADAADKARAVATSVLKRGASMLRERNMPAIRNSRVEMIGDEESYGAHARGRNPREIFCRVTVEAETPAAIVLLMREHGTAAVSMTPGVAGSAMIAAPVPMGRSKAFMLPATEIAVTVLLDDRCETVACFAHRQTAALEDAPPPPPPDRVPDTTCALSKLAWVRSGDKGDTCNIGIIARRPEYLPYIAAAMDEATVAARYAFMFRAEPGRVRRYYLPGIAALNFLLEDALDGGCTVSLRFDPFGKGAAQDVLDMMVPIQSSFVD
jgi:hypothetical protein